jgi:hypothetical protein
MIVVTFRTVIRTRTLIFTGKGDMSYLWFFLLKQFFGEFGFENLQG